MARRRRSLAALALSNRLAEHQGRVPQPGVPAGPRNSAGVAPPRHSGGTSGDLTIPHYTPETPTGTPYVPSEPGHAEQDFREAFKGQPQRHHVSSVADILGALDSLTAPILQPGRTIEQTARAALNLGVEPRALQEEVREGAKPEQVLAKAVGGALGHIVSGTQAPKIAAPQQAKPRAVDVAAKVRTEPAPKGPDPLGKKTLGKVTAAQLAHAVKEGTLRVSKQGVLSTPGNRHAKRQLTQAYEHFQATNGLRGPLTPGQIEFAKELSKATGGILKPRTIATQELQEESGSAAQQREAERNFNALNIGYFDSGPGQLTQDPVWSNPVTAAKATAEFFEGKRFSPSPQIASILEQARGKSVPEQLRIIGESGWATSAYASDLAQTAKLVSEVHDPQAAIQLQAAKKNAKAHGINPTPWNGDVTGGDREYVFVRADAKGMVDWLESAIGLQEGSTRQLAMASRLGLGSSEPWCANLVGNGLLRRGFTREEIPANPNATSSFEEWGREGRFATDIGTDLARAKPGDVLAFSGAHTATYVGNGEMISGNFSNEVERTPVSAGPAPLSMIIRPKYKGGKVKVKAGSLPGSSLGAASESFSGGEYVGGESPGSVSPGGVVPGAGAISEGRPVSIGEVPVDEILSAEHQILPPEQEGIIQRLIEARRVR